jgi:branched-chain amino acid transport system ATP-binding protein
MTAVHPDHADVLLDAHGLCAWYGAAQILFDLNLQVRRGEVVALMGRNGAGKSTTLKTLMGLMDKRKGTVRFMQRDVSTRQPYQIAALGMGFVPEDRRIFTDLTVAENLEVGRQPPRHWPDGTPAPTWTPRSSISFFPTWAKCPTAPAGA